MNKDDDDDDEEEEEEEEDEEEEKHGQRTTTLYATPIFPALSLSLPHQRLSMAALSAKAPPYFPVSLFF